MGFEDLPIQEKLPEWQQRIIDDAVEIRKEELMLQELPESELNKKVEEFRQVANELGTEKRATWESIIAKGGSDEDGDDPEEVEKKLSKGLVSVSKGKLKNILNEAA